MPIITPAFPAQNATHGVSQSTKAALLTEYEKGAMITDALLAPGSLQNQDLSWKRIFKKFPFFKAY
jgi:poly(A) polymerase Pap1